MKERILALIDTKIEEHQVEIRGCESFTAKLKVANAAQNPNVEFAQKMMILKDKQLFHKSCVSVLSDLLNEIKKL